MCDSFISLRSKRQSKAQREAEGERWVSNIIRKIKLTK